ncbi:MAG TPA: zinc ribbon domain-containing protein [Candidatus Saccharimonadia bacterium]|nr:zinc ribbon domain-containing protein [Candidatus Saccharimonadia bacterium]
MECPNCKQPVEAGAAFCGNCGYRLQAQADQQAMAAAASTERSGENRALLSVIFGAFGLAGSLFVAIAGLILGITGLVMGTTARSGTKRGLSTVGIVLSSLSLLAGLAVWTYAISHDASVKKEHAAAADGPSTVTSNVTTPCYSLSFADKLNVNQTSDSCDMKAFNGDTLEDSTEAYKVYASKSSISSAGSFSGLAKQAIEKDMKANLPTYAIGDEHVGSFAGSPDYVVVASDKSQHVTVAEAAVLHPVKSGDNIFILVHAINGDKADFSALEAQWQWQ